MKIALMSDLHANAQALQACIAHARTHGADGFAVLGDLVGYGGEPAAVVQQVMDLAEQGAVVIGGNHDAKAVSPPAAAERLDDVTAGWTHDQLSPAQRDFLRELPLTAQLESALLVHASADQPTAWRYMDRPELAKLSLDAACAVDGVRHVFGGHVHHQQLFYQGRDGALLPFQPQPGVPIPVPGHRRWLATIGSVGQPRDGDPRAMYALFDTKQAQLSFQRVAYDHRAAAAAVRRAGLPEYFAKRLEEGR